MNSRFLTLLSSSVLTIAAVGCGGGDNLQQVSGKAMFAGKPIVYGTIEFVPDVSKGGKGSQGSAEIVNGEYDTRKAGSRGVAAGPQVVRISAYEEKPNFSTDETVPSESKPLFIGYSVNVDKLTANHDFDVPESAKNFNLFKTQTNRPRANDP